MADDYDAVNRRAAESLASRTGMAIEQALEGIAFQVAAQEVFDDVEQAVGEASGGIWFDWSGGRGRVKIAVTTRIQSSKIDAATRILQNAGLVDRADFVKVVWSMRELAAGQERAEKLLEPLARVIPVSAGIDPSTNSVVIDVPEDLSAEQLKIVEPAVRSASVSVRVATGAELVQAAGG